MDPRLIRANIALFQGKRAETRRLIEEYAVEQEQPEVARREPMILWLDAHARPRHTERIEGLRTLVENAPADSVYHRMAQNYLEDEARYARQLEADQQRRPGPRRWQVIGALLLVAVVIGAFVIFGQLSAPPEVEITPTMTEEPPTLTPTVIVQNTPAPAQLADGSIPTTGFEALAFDGVITVRGVDRDVRYVVTASGEQVEPADAGAKFYGLLLEFQCLIPLCNNVPEAEIYVQLTTGNFRVLASEGLSLAGQETLRPRASQGQSTRGWVVFEVPVANPPSALVVWPVSASGEDERPDPIIIDLP
ncbi:MAG TPA: hypothetical protein VKY59_02040 [Spirillospora sp.]|nr:hypothetical protein [Spirillospora sp.]